MKYAELAGKYPGYTALISRIDVLLSSGSRPDDLLPDAYGWIERHMRPEDRHTARTKLETFCRLRREGRSHERTANT